MSQYEKPFLVNIEGPDDIEEFDTMREAAERANTINAELVDTISRGGEHAPHVWAVPWRTETYLAQFRDAESRQISSVLALGLPGTDLYDRIKEQADVGADETLGKWAYRSRLMVIAELLNAAPEPQGTDEDDQEYVARMKRERPDLSLDDLGFVDGQESQGEPSDALMIPRPHVPFGPRGVPEHEADADYLDHAASNLEGRYGVGGSNVRATVVSLLRDVAAALRAAGGVQ